MSMALLPGKWADGRILPIRLTTMQKVVFVSLTAGVTLLAVLARLLRRRKRPRPPRLPRKYIGRRTEQQFGVLGMEALDTVINYWEDALAVHYSPGGVPANLTSAEESDFCREIQNKLDMAYALQEQSKLLFLDQRDERSKNEADEEGVTVEEVADDDRQSVRSNVSQTGSDLNFDSAESYESWLTME